jgi:uncharacterized membrane protein
MKTRLLAYWDALRTSYWFVPTLMAIGAVGAALLSVTFDRRARELAGRFTVFAASPDGARAMLSTVASATITVAGLTFSLTIVALTVASQQFGPRLLRNFMRDLSNQIVLGSFVAIFIYCLLVLGAIRSPEEDAFVPYLSVTIGVGISILGLGVLIYFIHHVSTSIHAANVIEVVGREIDGAIDRLFPEHIGAAGPRPDGAVPVPDGPGGAVCARGDGYLQAIDGDGLLEAARACDAVVRLECRPGDLIVAGNRVATVWPAAEASLAERINEALVVGVQRTDLQDLEFSIDQLVEVAARALSPGVNDPFTAMNCIDRLCSPLCRLAARELPSPARRDADGAVRLILRPWTFIGAVDAAFNQIRQYGRGSAAVTMRLLEALAILAGRVCRPDDAAAVLRQAEMIARGAEDGLAEPRDRAEAAERFARVRQRLAERSGKRTQE